MLERHEYACIRQKFCNSRIVWTAPRSKHFGSKRTNQAELGLEETMLKPASKSGAEPRCPTSLLRGLR
jgi:hypothetical protein